MSLAFRAALAVSVSLAFASGSWVGLGRPTLATTESRLLPRAFALAEPLFASPSVPSVPAEPAPAPSPPGPSFDLPPLPEQSDAPAQKPWPELNAQATIQRAWVVAEGPRREPGDPHRLVTLTFDDGPFLATTPKVLHLLAREKIHATFFVIGEYLDGDDHRAHLARQLLRRMVAAGHLIGNHTHDHARLSMRSQTQVLEQIDQGSASIERAIGRRPMLFRPPFGELDAFGEQAVHARGLDLILWNVEANDMLREDSHAMFREIARALDRKEGGMVLLHDVRFSSLAVLRELLPWLHDHRWDPRRPTRVGYEVVDLPTYLRAAAASPQPFENREELDKAREQRSKGRRVERAPEAPGEG
jgi:peptidoglycan/xylan/chitin deacetylase (PgdA/CDA1 family)